MIVHTTEPYNAEPPRHALADDAVTPVEAFFARDHGAIPRIEPTDWRVQIDGLVERPITLSLANLRERFDHREVVATLRCAGNRRVELMAARDIPGETPWGSGAVSTARWTGVSLADVLAAAGPLAGAAHIAFDGPDVSDETDPPEPFGGSIPLAKAMAGEVLLAWAMNGEPLPRPHGGPVRIIVPGYIGARSVKWIRRVTAHTTPSDNFFQRVRYQLLPADAEPHAPDGLPLGPLSVNSDILRPGDGETVPAGPVTVTGYACGGEGREIARVDVSANGGRTWAQAALGPTAGPWAWRLWHHTLDLSPGEATVTARAWDSAGATQPEDPARLWNPGGYANNAWARIRLDVRL